MVIKDSPFCGDFIELNMSFIIIDRSQMITPTASTSPEHVSRVWGIMARSWLVTREYDNARDGGVRRCRVVHLNLLFD